MHDPSLLYPPIGALKPVGAALHYLHMAEWQRAWPDAVPWASPGVRDRAARHGHALRIDRDLGDRPPPQRAREIDQHLLLGGRCFQEVVFFHRASATLILTDLIENFEVAKLPRRWRWPARLAGIMAPDGKAPADMRLTFWGHRDAARGSPARLLSWRPKRGILAHARWYEQDGSQDLTRAMRWLD